MKCWIWILNNTTWQVKYLFFINRHPIYVGIKLLILRGSTDFRWRFRGRWSGSFHRRRPRSGAGRRPRLAARTRAGRSRCAGGPRSRSGRSGRKIGAAPPLVAVGPMTGAARRHDYMPLHGSLPSITCVVTCTLHTWLHGTLHALLHGITLIITYDYMLVT